MVGCHQDVVDHWDLDHPFERLSWTHEQRAGTLSLVATRPAPEGQGDPGAVTQM